MQFTTIQQLMEALGVSVYPKRWEGLYAQAVETWQRDENPLLHPEYYRQLQQSYGVLPDFLQIYQSAAGQVAKNPALALFFTLLCRAMEDRALIQEDIAQLELPQAPAGQPTLGYDMLTALVMLQSVPENYRELTRRGVPEADRDFALRAPEYNVTGGVLKGRPCLEHFGYYQKAYDCRMHRFGRLEYEFPKAFAGGHVFAHRDGQLAVLADGQRFHAGGQVLGSRGFTQEEGAFTAAYRETENAFIGHRYDENGCAGAVPVALEKDLWRKVLSPADSVVGIHIPGGYVHGPLTEQRVSDSLEQARQVLSECYPDYRYQAFFCHSWLVDPTLGRLLEGSNLHSFCRRFLPFGTQVSGGMSVWDYVFGVDRATPVPDLPENTSLQRRIKKWYLQGGMIRNMSGIILP